VARSPDDPLPVEDELEKLRAWRAELDHLNHELLQRVQERARIVAAVARFKRARGMPAFDAAREQAMLVELLAAPGEGFSRAELERLLRVAMRFYRRLARRAAEEG
jgi:chorismate mutase